MVSFELNEAVSCSLIFCYGTVDLNIKDISNIQTLLPLEPHIAFSLCTRTPVSF